MHIGPVKTRAGGRTFCTARHWLPDPQAPAARCRHAREHLVRRPDPQCDECARSQYNHQPGAYRVLPLSAYRDW
jgi:hypothetical protein